jgi:hypothetical protein
MENHKLVIIEEQENNLPKYHIETDYQYFTLESLVRLYGLAEVRRFLRSKGVLL